MVENREMATELAEASLDQITDISYRLALDDRGKLQWHAMIDGVEVVETSEPLASGFRKFMAFLLKVVPESQL